MPLLDEPYLCCRSQGIEALAEEQADPHVSPDNHPVEDKEQIVEEKQQPTEEIKAQWVCDQLHNNSKYRFTGNQLLIQI